MLKVEFDELSAAGFNLEFTGFSLGEISELTTGMGLGAGGDADSNTPPESWAVIVECTDEAAQVALINRLQDLFEFDLPESMPRS